MNKIVLSCENVGRSFIQGGETLDILKNINFTMKASEKIALIGPSGSGKTTLLSLAGLLDNPTKGNIIINGHNTSKMKDQEKSHFRRDTLGFIYQYHHLLPEFTALENVMMPFFIAKRQKEEAKKKAELLLERVGLSHRLQHFPSILSGGEQQRVAIARSLALEPLLLLADEPTGNLDTSNASSIMALLMEVLQETRSSLLLVTHNIDLASKMDRMVTLSDLES